MGDGSNTASGKRLKSFVERIEQVEGERKALGQDVRDIYSEAKGAGYDTKTIRWLVQERKIDAATKDERDALRDTYAHAVGMAVDLVRTEGLSLREAARKTGASKSSIHRALAVPEASQTGGGDKSKVITPPEVASLPLATPARAEGDDDLAVPAFLRKQPEVAA